MTSADCMNTNCDVVLALPHILLSLSLILFYQRVPAKYLSAATLRNTIQCIFVVPVLMTSQSLPVKLMELNCKIYFWMEKGKRRTTTERKGRNNKKKGLNGIWHKQHNVPVHCAYTRPHRHRENWWTGDNGTTITTTTGKRLTTKIHINIIFNSKLCVCVMLLFLLHIFGRRTTNATLSCASFHSDWFVFSSVFCMPPHLYPTDTLYALRSTVYYHLI